ncbi:MAG: hypothetical protein ACPGOV_01230 [Magnetovibrionaceae bacterium]
MVGMTPAAIVSSLGEPGLRRLDRPAEYWQYKRLDCVLDVIFYEQTSGGDLSVDHVEARDREGRALSPDACLGQAPQAPKPTS